MIGKTKNGYSFVGNINNRVVLAHNPKAVEPWVVCNSKNKTILRILEAINGNAKEY